MRARTLETNEYPRALAWAPRDAKLTVGLGDGTIAWIQPDRGTLESRRDAHGAAILGMAWNPRGEELATTGEDGWVRVWGGARAEKRWEFDWGTVWPEHVAWSSDGEHLAVAGGTRVGVWDRAGRRVMWLECFGSTVSGLVWRSDGRELAAACYGVVQIFRLGEDVPAAALVWKSSFLSLAWSSDGRHLAAGTQENSVTYWKAPFGDGDPLQMSGYSSKVKRLAWDHRSRFLATSGGEVATIWDVSGAGPAGTRPKQLTGHGGRVTALVYKPGGDVLATGGLDGQVRLWNPMAGEHGVTAHEFRKGIEGLAWSPSGSWLAASAANGTVALFA